MGNRYLVVSDLHLTDVEDHEDGWKAFKGTPYVFDEEFDALVRRFEAHGAEGDRLTLVLNGDIIDFDLVVAVPDEPPWPVSKRERVHGLDPTAEKSAWKLELVLSHHGRFLETLARFLAAGHNVVYVLGNHDRELHFEAVQQAFIRALERRARQDGLSLTRGSFHVEPWFYYVPGEIYAEHGHQYDFYNSFRYLLHPEVELDGERQLALPMGDLSNRLLATRMGTFNPHAGNFILNLFAYAVHWARYYALSKRSLVLAWFFGSLAVVRLSLRLRRLLRQAPPEHKARLARVGRYYDLSLAEVSTLGALQRRPITQRFYRLLRELWIDRLIIALLMTGGTVTLGFSSAPLWAKLMVPLTAFPLLYFVYEYLSRGETIFTIEEDFPRRARSVAQTLPARVITFGHTHKPRLIPICRETTFVDTGTWAPVYPSHGRRNQLSPGLRNYLMVSFQRQEATIALESWMPGAADRARKETKKAGPPEPRPAPPPKEEEQR